jgi:hypothetical protein
MAPALIRKWHNKPKGLGALLQALGVFRRHSMGEKNYSWKGSWNAGLVLSLLALVGAGFLILAGFGG